MADMMNMKKTWADWIFDFVNYGLMVLLTLLTLLPFLHIISKAFSGAGKVTAGLITFYPQDIQLNAIKYVLADNQFLSSFRVSVIVTIAGTASAMLLTVLTAYPLSKPALRGRKPMLYLHILTMLFSGGMIPVYLVYSTLGLLNTLPAMILPGMLSTFNMLIVKNYFETLPESVEEAAIIDGAGIICVLFAVVLPISLPVIATISLFYAVGYWNSYFSALLYITIQDLKPLSLYLYELIQKSISVSDLSGFEGMNEAMNLVGDSIRAATIVVSTVPILILYPLLQKHFVKGITIGSVKG